MDKNKLIADSQTALSKLWHFIWRAILKIFYTDLHLFIQKRAGWFALISYAASGLIFISVSYGELQRIAFIISMLFTIVLFTRPMLPVTRRALNQPEGDDQLADMADENDDAVNVLFRIAYGFIILVIFIAASLVFSDEYIYKTSDNQRTIIGLVEGCDYQEQTLQGRETEKRAVTIPADAHCGSIPPQWVISIGGKILENCRINGDCKKHGAERVTENTGLLTQKTLSQNYSTNELNVTFFDQQVIANTSTAELRHQLKKVNKLINQKQSKLNSLKTSLEGVEAVYNMLGEYPKDPNKIESSIAKTKAQVAILNRDKSTLENELIRRQQRPEIVNISMLPELGKPIIGGIIVPVYFVVIAIIGALIGMARKMPEFQRRGTITYQQKYSDYLQQDNNMQPPMTAAHIREAIIFQMIQVCCAPGIAILAYAYVQQESDGANAILAFAAGFSSEIFLRAIRALVDKFIADGPKAASPPKTIRQPANAASTLPIEPTPVNQSTSLTIVSLKPFNQGDKCVLIQALKLNNQKTLAIGQQGIITEVLTNARFKVLFSITDNQQQTSVEAVVDRSILAHPDEVSSSLEQLRG